MNPRKASRPSDRKSRRLNSSHPSISYAVFCLKKKHQVAPLDRVRDCQADRRLYLHQQCSWPRRLKRLSISVTARPVSSICCSLFFFFNETATREFYTLSLHDALPI